MARRLEHERGAQPPAQVDECKGAERRHLLADHQASSVLVCERGEPEQAVRGACQVE